MWDQSSSYNLCEMIFYHMDVVGIIFHSITMRSECSSFDSLVE